MIYIFLTCFLIGSISCTTSISQCGYDGIIKGFTADGQFGCFQLECDNDLSWRLCGRAENGTTACNTLEKNFNKTKCDWTPLSKTLEDSTTIDPATSESTPTTNDPATSLSTPTTIYPRSKDGGWTRLTPYPHTTPRGSTTSWASTTNTVPWLPTSARPVPTSARPVPTTTPPGPAPPPPGPAPPPISGLLSIINSLNSTINTSITIIIH